jgi:histidinol-phosphate aminotransferase
MSKTVRGTARDSVVANTVVSKLKAYDPGHDLPALRRRFGATRLAELGSNENAFGPSPTVLDVLHAAPREEMFRYPDPMGLALRTALAHRIDATTSEIVLGNGSHELLMLVAQVFAEPGDEIVFSEFGFAVFAIATAAVGATPVRVPALPLTAAMPRGHDLDAIATAITPRTRLIYLANPNNPTGTWFARDALAAFLARVPRSVLVVVDEAYHESVTAAGVGSALELRARYRNVAVTRTFSKTYGLAGLRVGYLVGDASVVDAMNRLRESFNVNAFALLAAQAALSDEAHVAMVRSRTAAMRDALAAQVILLGLRVHPSQTNFILIDFERDAAPIEAKLLAQGVVVRPMGGYGLPTCLRVSIGSEAENAAFLAALREALK